MRIQGKLQSASMNRHDLTPQQIEVLSRCPKMTDIISRLNLSAFEIQQSLYHELTAAIVFQQISVKAADAVYRRYKDMVGWDYVPDQVLQFTVEDLKSVGLSKQKANYILNIAEYFKSNPKVEETMLNATDDEVVKALTSIKGVGIWTAKMVLMFYLQREDIFPYEDLGVEMAMVGLYDLPVEKKERRLAMIAHADQWKPYRSIASFYLWAWKREN